ncbi:MAG TPA: hypothetical protein VMV29_04310 [Ktedonobacterales bacterium]|nr:hypothetical protein [Ktedonobacterales bacterium]
MGQRKRIEQATRDGVARRWGIRTWRRTVALALLTLGLGAVLAACGGSPSGTSSATATTPAGGGFTPGATNNTPPPGFPTPTVTPNGGGVQAGVSDVCGETPNVVNQPPSNLPVYPNAQLVQGANTKNNGQTVGVFDFCTSASPDAVVTFYTQQLPTQGWQQVQTYTGTDAKSITAKQGNEQLTISALVDTPNPSQPTEILVSINGLPS